MNLSRIPISLEILEHLRTHLENKGTDVCNFDIEVAKTFSGKTTVRFFDTENGVVIEQHFLEEENDEIDRDINLHIILRRRDFPFQN